MRDKPRPTLSFVHFDGLDLVHQVVGAPLGNVLDEDLLTVREVLCGDSLHFHQRQQALGLPRQRGGAGGGLFTVSVEELVVRAVLGVSGDALHPPL